MAADPKVLLEKVRKHIAEDCAHYGHELFCKAIKGPEGQCWYEDHLCNCSRREALDALEQLVLLVTGAPRVPPSVVG